MCVAASSSRSPRNPRIMKRVLSITVSARAPRRPRHADGTWQNTGCDVTPSLPHPHRIFISDALMFDLQPTKCSHPKHKSIKPAFVCVGSSPDAGGPRGWMLLASPRRCLSGSTLNSLTLIRGNHFPHRRLQAERRAPYWGNRADRRPCRTAPYRWRLEPLPVLMWRPKQLYCGMRGHASLTPVARASHLTLLLLCRFYGLISKHIRCSFSHFTVLHFPSII